jgi:hypothetical protein
MSTVEEMLANIRIRGSHRSAFAWSIGHMTIVALNPFLSIRTGFPLEMSRFNPDTIWAFFIVTGSTKISLGQKI